MLGVYFSTPLTQLIHRVSFKKQIIGGDPHLAIPYRCVGFTGTTFLFVFDLFVFMKKEECFYAHANKSRSENSKDQIRRSG